MVPGILEAFLGCRPPSHSMCLAIPGKVLEIQGNVAKVDFGNGVIRDADITLVDVDVGKYVLVHTGYAIQVMEEEDARETLDLWREILDAFEQSPQDEDGA